MKQFLIALLLASALAVAAQPYCIVRRFSLRDGLASNVISSIIQTEDQLMWFSSWNGLNSYDGYLFTTFNDHSDFDRTLTTNRLLKITPSSCGNIWCLTYDRQVFLFDRSSGRFLNVSAVVGEVSGEPFNCQRIASLPNGRTWLFNREEGGPCFRIDEQRGLTAGSVEMFSRNNGRLFGTKVHGVEIDGEGREWLCTDGGVGIVGTEQEWELPYTYVRQIGQEVYLATTDGRFGCFDGKDIVPLRIQPEVKDEVRGLEVIGNRHLLAVTGAGLLVYDTKSRQSWQIAGTDDCIDEIETDSRQRIWALTASGEVLMGAVDRPLQRVLVAGIAPALSQSNRQLVHEDSYGTVWVGNSQGFFGYYDELSGQLMPCTIRTSAAQPAIERWFADSRGDLWFAGEHDLAVINFGQRVFCPVVMEQMQQVRSICYDSHGRLWTGDIAGHVVVTDSVGVKYLGSDGQLKAQPTSFASYIYCLYEDSRQRLWIGTKGDGLYCVATDGHVSHYRHVDGDAGSLPSDQIYDVLEDHRHRLWVGTFEQGICLLNGDTFIHVGNQLSQYPVKDFFKVRRIAETPDGIIIVSASNGLVTFSEQFDTPSNIRFFAHKHVPGDSTSLLTSDVMQVCPSHDGRVYVATVGGGMQAVGVGNLLSERLKLTTVLHGEGHFGTILNMLEDRSGNLWTGHESSLAMCEATTGKRWLFGPSHLGENTELTEARPAFNPKTGQIAFATTNGYICFHPELIGQETFVPSLVFRNAYFHGTQKTVHLTTGDTLDVPAKQRNLTIHFAALDYHDNYMIRYAYKMEGVDDEWNDLGTEHSISFSNLSPGHHRLLVRSTNQYGTWADNDRVLCLFIRPTFWETWWAKLLYLLLLAGVVAVGVWIYLLRTRAEQERQKSRMLSLLIDEIKTQKPSARTLSEEAHPEEDVAGVEGSNVLRLRPTDIVDSDKQMMEDLLAYIENHLSDPDLKVEELAQSVCLGRTAFYNKVKSLVGMSPVELLRHIRIRHAEDMVAKSSEPFSQIAYAVGFSDSHYFGKCFKKQTGLTPSEYREQASLRILKPES